VRKVWNVVEDKKNGLRLGANVAIVFGGFPLSEFVVCLHSGNEDFAACLMTFE
jgi:hypothetical protein